MRQYSQSISPLHQLIYMSQILHNILGLFNNPKDSTKWTSPTWPEHGWFQKYYQSVVGPSGKKSPLFSFQFYKRLKISNCWLDMRFPKVNPKNPAWLYLPILFVLHHFCPLMQSFVYLIAETQIWHWSAIPVSNIQSLFFLLCIHLSISLSHHYSPPCVNLTLDRIIQICCSLQPTLHSCHHQLNIRWNQPAQQTIQNQCLVNNAMNNLVPLWKS